MRNWFLMFVAACFFACGSAPAAKPKSANPPVAEPEPLEKPPPAGDSWMMAFEQLGISIELPHHRWAMAQNGVELGPSSLQLDLAGTSVSIFLKAYLNAELRPLKDILEEERQAFLSQAGLSVSEAFDDDGGRWAFRVEVAMDAGEPLLGTQYIVPVPGKADGYLSMAIIGRRADYETHLDEAHRVIQSVKPLPK